MPLLIINGASTATVQGLGLKADTSSRRSLIYFQNGVVGFRGLGLRGQAFRTKQRFRLDHNTVDAPNSGFYDDLDHCFQTPAWGLT